MKTAEGSIVKALSGYYYVRTAAGALVTCRARGKLRIESVSPLVGDRVLLELGPDGTGTVREILPRRNHFIRPAVANVDLMVMVAAAVNPVTDPFLIDRVSVLAARHDCGFLLCLNKTDRDRGDGLYDTYLRAGIPVLRVSALTGEGLSALREALAGKVCVFTGNSGVGKSSLLNALEPDLTLPTGEVSERLGRGKHTTRHVELFRLSCGAYLADTPGFGSFDVDQLESVRGTELPACFLDLAPYLGRCRFTDCKHLREPDCAVTQALEAGRLERSRYDSYVRLRQQAEQLQEWQLKTE